MAADLSGRAEDGGPRSSMTRRLALALATVALVALAAVGWTSVRLVDNRADSMLTETVLGIGHGFTRELSNRLATAQAIVQYFAAAGGTVTDLQERVSNSDVVRGVLLRPLGAESTAEYAADGLPVFDVSDRLALDAGQSLLKIAYPERNRQRVYIVHEVNISGKPQLAFFEVNPPWLWRDAQDLQSRSVFVAVVDSTGRVLYNVGPLSNDTANMVARAPVDMHSPTLLHSWQEDGKQWRGTITRLDFSASRVMSSPWNTMAYLRIDLLGGALADFMRYLPGLLLLLGAVVLAMTLYLRRGWQPVLSRLTTALASLRNGEFERVNLSAATDTPRALAASYNATVAVLEQKMRGLAQLGEIDRLLLESVELEQSLDAILGRISAVTGAHGAALTLIDPDAPGYGRSFASVDSAECAVSRINVDRTVLDAVQVSPNGLTVARCEPDRHTFLVPLREQGATFFRVWPVVAQDRIAGVLSIGYLDAADTHPELAPYGTDCAIRLAVALSNSARDERLYQQAHFDSLTSLPNRLLFSDRLSQELARTADGSRGALLYVDLDHFKKVNDSVGHMAGDQLLTIVAQRLRGCVKEGDTVARLGGDEFTVILRNVNAPQAAKDIADRIIEALQRPVSIAGRDQFVCASIGITLFPDDGTTIEDLTRNADLAMYQAKDGGRSRAVFFDSKMAHVETQVAQSGLFRALRRREFSLFYQPQYSLKDGQLVALEALLRWQTPHNGMRMPMEFIPAAEESGLIVDIGTWVLESACSQLALWREQRIAPERVALNISVQQLRAQDFVKVVRRALGHAGIPPDMLELELTESAFADQNVHQTLKDLALLGVRLSLDDFGTGYSSLNYLRQHPVHAIKIDRSFMPGVPGNSEAATLAETIINMAHALNKQVVAEGVETMEQLDFLRERGCDIAQGYVLAKPASAADITELLMVRKPQREVLQRAAS